MDENETGEIVEKMKHFLSYRDRSKKEVIRHIRKKNLTSQDNEQAILTLIQSLGFVDDHRFARNRANYRIRNGHGTFYVRSELMISGVDRNIIDDVIQNISEDDIVDGGTPVALQRWKKNNDRDALVRFLGQRGYSHSHIKRIISNILDPEGAHDE